MTIKFSDQNCLPGRNIEVHELAGCPELTGRHSHTGDSACAGNLMTHSDPETLMLCDALNARDDPVGTDQQPVKSGICV